MRKLHIARKRRPLARGQDLSFVKTRITRRDGSTYWLGMTIRPIFDAAGRVTHSVAMGADITAKREETRKKQELQDKLVEGDDANASAWSWSCSWRKSSNPWAGLPPALPTRSTLRSNTSATACTSCAAPSMTSTGLSMAGARPSKRCPTAHRRTMRLGLRSQRLWPKYDLDFLRAEVPKAFERTFDGVERVTNIVKAMKEFAHPDTDRAEPGRLEPRHAKRRCWWPPTSTSTWPRFIPNSPSCPL